MPKHSLRCIWFLPPPLAIIAEKRGAYDLRGLTIVGELTRSSDQQFEALAAGAADAAVTAMDNVFGWNRRGKVDDFVIVAQMERTTVLPLIARPEVDRIEQLVGCNLLVDSAENGFVVALRAMLYDAGIAADQYRLLIAGGVRQRLEALMAGTGDATLLGPPFDTEAQSKGFKLLGRVGDVYPNFPGLALIMRRSVLTDKLATVSLWLDSLRESKDWFGGNESEATDLLIQYGFPQPAAQAMLSTLPSSHEVDPLGVELLIDHRRKLGLAGADESYLTLVDQRLFRGSTPSTEST